MQVFSEKGFEDATVADLLTAAGIARRTFYRHFSNKHDVLEELFQMVIRALSDEIAEAARDADDMWTGMMRGLDVYLEFHTTNRLLMSTMLSEAKRPSSPLFAHRQRYRATLVSQLSLALQVRCGRHYDPLVGSALFGALDALSEVLLADEEGPAQLDRVRAVVMALLAMASQADSPLPNAADVAT